MSRLLPMKRWSQGELDRGWQVLGIQVPTCRKFSSDDDQSPGQKQMTNLRAPLQRNDDRAKWQNPSDTKRLLSLLVTQVTVTGLPGPGQCLPVA